MLDTTLTISGGDYSVAQAVRRMKKKVKLADLDNMIIKMPARTGSSKAAEQSLRLVLSGNSNAKRHCKEVDCNLRALMSFIADEKARHPKLSVCLSTGLGAGTNKHFTRSFVIPSSLMAQLAALGIDYEVTAYPCCE